MFKRLGRIGIALRGLFFDVLYDETILESILQQTFGHKQFFGYVTDSISGTRVALTATSHGNSRYIFANYNWPRPNSQN
jgi:hypothetical protein